MNELAAQKLIIDAVRSVGGAGWKLSNRFLVGVPDLLLCLPRQPIGVWEVKISDRKKSDMLTLKITPLQEKTLNDLHNAGGYCGVISFLRDGSKLFMNAYTWDVVSYSDQWLPKFKVGVLDHEELERGHREEKIVDILEQIYGQRV